MRKITSSSLKVDDHSQIISYVETIPENHRKTFLELASGPSRYIGVHDRVIQSEHNKRVSQRHLAHLKPLSSQKTIKTRRDGQKLITMGHLKTRSQFYRQSKLG
ncbi:Bgt-50155 [Blumeria graminis f. sp. tritici]|uniref:Bgt-50155 n=1 Tax=Blumeria graminis f. sp. tritici TaxID=62690 RepID=A0A9X9LA74_BLUGR|nr:Bgt-50155 [Blumeria graminis f. sp. tritici]